MRDVLSGRDVAAATPSRRASERLVMLRERFDWLDGKGIVVRDRSGAVTWWTFAGLLANLWLAEAVAGLRSGTRLRANLAIRLADGVTATDVTQPSLSAVAADAVDRLKSAGCLPRPLPDRSWNPASTTRTG